MLNPTGWYLFSVINSHLASSASRLQLHLYLSSPQNYLSLVVPPILSAGLLANHFYETNTCDKSLQICTRALFHHSQVPNKFWKIRETKAQAKFTFYLPNLSIKKGPISCLLLALSLPLSAQPYYFMFSPSPPMC